MTRMGSGRDIRAIRAIRGPALKSELGRDEPRMTRITRMGSGKDIRAIRAIRGPALNLEFWEFGFVSDFKFRIFQPPPKRQLRWLSSGRGFTENVEEAMFQIDWVQGPFVAPNRRAVRDRTTDDGGPI
jgi:hypothetical protein